MTVTAADVANWASFPIPTGDELDLLESVVAAVTVQVARNYLVSTPMRDDERIAIIMQAAALWRRRLTPEGVLSFDELGAVRVSRLDPDVERLLRPRWALS